MASLLAGLRRWQGFVLAVAMGLILCPPSASAAAQAAAARPTVAVLPLANASGDANQDFFSEGLTDEIAVALTRVPGIGIVARSSIFRFKEPSHDFAAIGKAVNARYLVDGSARKVDTLVRITSRLIRVVRLAQLRSEDYYTELSNIF